MCTLVDTIVSHIDALLGNWKRPPMAMTLRLNTVKQGDVARFQAYLVVVGCGVRAFGDQNRDDNERKKHVLLK